MRTLQAVFTHMRTFVIVPKNKGIVMSKLYESILSLCTEAGIKGGKMCVDVGLSKSFMTDLKTGRRNGMSASTAQKIADYFGVSVDRVMGVEKEPHVPKDIRLSDEELDFIQWYRTAATEKDKALIKTIVERE